MLYRGPLKALASAGLLVKQFRIQRCVLHRPRHTSAGLQTSKAAICSGEGKESKFPSEQAVTVSKKKKKYTAGPFAELSPALTRLGAVRTSQCQRAERHRRRGGPRSPRSPACSHPRKRLPRARRGGGTAELWQVLSPARSKAKLSATLPGNSGRARGSADLLPPPGQRQHRSGERRVRSTPRPQPLHGLGWGELNRLLPFNSGTKLPAAGRSDPPARGSPDSAGSAPREAAAAPSCRLCPVLPPRKTFSAVSRLPGEESERRSGGQSPRPAEKGAGKGSARETLFSPPRQPGGPQPL